MPTFTSYWQDSISGMSVRGHQARLKGLENELTKLGWEIVEDSHCDLALFDVYDESHGISMVRSSGAKNKVWIGNKTANDMKRVFSEDINIYVDQDWNDFSIMKLFNKFIISYPIIDDKAISEFSAKQIERTGKTVFIPGGNRYYFLEELERIMPNYWDGSDFVIAENMDREELWNLCLSAVEVYCTPSVVAMELKALGINPNLIVTSIDQIGNFMNQDKLKDFTGNAKRLAEFINNFYNHRERMTND